MELSGIDKIVRSYRSTSERVCEILRRAIILQTLPMGERLVEAKIASELKVSTTPVRAAFSQLANMGLVTVYPYKGTYVTIITQEYIKNVCFVRERIECAGVELSFEQMTTEDALRIEEFSSKSDYYFGKDLLMATEYDVLCHQQFLEKCGNELLLQMWHLLKHRVQFAQSYTKPVIQPANFTQMRHGEFAACIRSNNKEGLLEAVTSHIRSTTQYRDFPLDSEIVLN